MKTKIAAGVVALLLPLGLAYVNPVDPGNDNPVHAPPVEFINPPPVNVPPVDVPPSTFLQGRRRIPPLWVTAFALTVLPELTPYER
jgi:hypothetical protein